MLVQFDCGCVGFPEAGNRALIVEACDADRNAPRVELFWRPMGKQSSPLAANRENDLLVELAQLVADGNRFRELIALLNRPASCG